ncbi:ribosome biogenesis GTPase Der [Mycoplasma phocimorsus]|uniref:ribosome biogenesis GTPase Der n=1 Tax=Mycoplasma phocimorsus TaxID=3045839 RepID=UPI0024BFC212|nr:ribosome biogenesis GTPase Der [Mycoplasma phocimorsus]MDJ1646501.1 ribosome biogenesis GTPase Der [Mycoplasma phocimorsus]MDJ1646938.1 ribosome biogenesis GTPase Der [Mycoplasma phocimorsus]MDJ1648362.1 ribosome biogenesis GTPase Der [Mycoplasma phocimorsus]
MNNIVALIGRPNVGKSTLFNRIIQKRKSIVDDQPGVTRDRLYHKAHWQSKEFYIIDTGGIHIDHASFQKEILIQAEIAIEEANVIIFVADARSEITNDDLFIINKLRKSGKKVILAMNKLEHNNDMVYSWFGTGIDEVFQISALHGQGIGDLLDCVTSYFSKISEKESKNFKISIIGKPNAGKSSLFNLLSNENRSIVSDIPGTTRDSVSNLISINKKDYEIIDTAGILKKSRLVESVEHYALMRAQRSLSESDLSIILIDASKDLDHFDSKIVGYALENNKPIIVLINKWDLIKKDTNTQKEYEKKIRNKLHFIPWVPIIFISVKDNKNINKFVSTLEMVRDNLTRIISPSVLTNILLDMQTFRQPKSYHGGVLQIKLIKQIPFKIPMFNLYVNNKNYLHFTYERAIENELRESINLEGCPIKLNFINK